MTDYKFYQCVYDLQGNRLNQTNVWTPINFWDDACWDRAVPRDCSGLTYLDVGCNEGLYLLRFEQSGGKAFGLDPSGLGFWSSIPPEYYGKPYVNEGYLMLKDMYKAKYEAQAGGFSNGVLVPAQKEKFNIVSCMNTLEYVKEVDTAIAELFSVAKDRVIICTETSLDKPTWYADSYHARAINLVELLSKIPNIWEYEYWTYTLNRNGELHHEVFLIADKPESKLAPVETYNITFNLDITETQRNRGTL